MAKVKPEAVLEVGVSEVVDYQRIIGSFSEALREVIHRKVTSAAAKKAKMRVTAKELQKAADGFRIINDLQRAKDTNAWLAARGISIEAFEEYLETNILVNKFKTRLEKEAGLKKYASTPEIKDAIREKAYEDWLKKTI